MFEWLPGLDDIRHLRRASYFYASAMASTNIGGSSAFIIIPHSAASVPLPFLDYEATGTFQAGHHEVLGWTGSTEGILEGPTVVYSERQKFWSVCYLLTYSTSRIGLNWPSQ
jgi:hypothetical protein